MERFIGLDVHKVSTTLAVVGPTGRHIRTLVLETSGSALVEAMRLIPGEKHLCLENCPQAPWLLEILGPLVNSFAMAQKSAKGESSRDESDAVALAQMARTGQPKRLPLTSNGGAMTRLRILAATYQKIVGDLVRCKNRLQTLYRSRGVQTTAGDSSLYRLSNRDGSLQKLPTPARTAGELLFREHDALSELRIQARHEMVTEARTHHIFRVLKTCPGLGEVRVALMLPIVVTPHRFRSKRQFWSYCGFGVRTRSSADWAKDHDNRWELVRRPQVLGLSKTGNRTLKTLFIAAALTAIKRSPEVQANYERLIAGTTKPTMARLTIARKLAAITLAMWKTEEEYRPENYAHAP